MAYSLTIRDLVNDVVITKDGFATVTEAKNDAEMKNGKKYATYAWLPMHPRYEPHLVMRGGYFRKAVA